LPVARTPTSPRRRHRSSVAPRTQVWNRVIRSCSNSGCRARTATRARCTRQTLAGARFERARVAHVIHRPTCYETLMRFRILSNYVAPFVATTAVGCSDKTAENAFALTPPRLCIDRSEASRCPSGAARFASLPRHERYTNSGSHARSTRSRTLANREWPRTSSSSGSHQRTCGVQ